MKPIIDILEQRVSKTIADVTGADAPAVVKPTQDPNFGDYQANGIMSLAKKLKQNPRQLAQEIVAQLDVSDMCAPPEIAGPGFINFQLKPDWLAQNLAESLKDKDRLGVDPLASPPTTVIDFSGPNIAKQMHVGHLRSTIIGDVIARILDFWYNDPHKVIRQNHIGDWGTQFGMVILGLWHLCMSEKHKKEGESHYIKNELPELRRSINDDKDIFKLLKKIRDRHEKDWRDDYINEEGDGKKVFAPFLAELNLRNKHSLFEELLEAYQYVNIIEEQCRGLGLQIPTRQRGMISYELLSRHVTAMLQKSGDRNEQEYTAWEQARNISLDNCQDVYKILGVQLDKKDVKGESDYNNDLPNVIDALDNKEMTEKSEGAKCVFLEGFKSKNGDPLPLIVQKSDGAYLYATTDLAAIRFRVDELKAQRIIYVTDSRQKLHFEMVFACASKAGWADDNIKLEHVPFGSVLGGDGKPFKTRSGENIKLKDLLDEAETRARKIVDEKNPDLDETLKQQIAHAVGIGAVKYADLSNNLVSDYVFDWDKMLAMEGNTAPYLQYAYARIRSIFRKGDINENELLAQDHPFILNESKELTLAKLLLRYGEIIETVARDLRPHLLTNYLFDLAQAFSGFYTNCPVLKVEESIRTSRLLLCLLTARTLEHGLHLLGIKTPDQM